MHHHPWLVLFPLATAEGLSLETLASAIPAGQRIQLESWRSSGQGVTGAWDGDAVAIAHVPQPVPTRIWEGPAATAWHWPEAARTISEHTSHLLLTLASDARDPVRVCLGLTQLSAAVATAANPLAVLWGPAGKLHQPDAFIEQASESARDQLPLHLWLDFRIEAAGNDRNWLFTTGLERLGHAEIEITPSPRPPQQLLEAAYNAAHFILDGTESVQDGTTLSFPDTTQATVRLAPSLSENSDREVFQLRLD